MKGEGIKCKADLWVLDTVGEEGRPGGHEGMVGEGEGWGSEGWAWGDQDGPREECGGGESEGRMTSRWGEGEGGWRD